MADPATRPSAGGPDPQSFLPLHPLELRILLVLLERTGHGYRIVKEIEARDGEWARIYPANLYRRIRRLVDDGLLVEADPPEDDAGADARRTYFRVTPLGREVARAEAARLRELVADAAATDLLESAP